MCSVNILYLHLIVAWITSPWLPLAEGCSEGCSCGPVKPESGEGLKMVCKPKAHPISSIQDLQPSIPINITQLILRGNAITTLKKDDFASLDSLQKLDLADNQISRIEVGAFNGLQNLTRLNLAGNLLETLPDDTFRDLTSLKRVDFTSDYLRCDCHLQWLVRWRSTAEKSILGSTKCGQPRDLKGTLVRSLKKKDFHCNWPVELDQFTLTPSTSQIVFQGDKLPLECSASADPSTRVVWVRKDVEVVANRSLGIFVHTRRSADGTRLTTSLVLEHLTVKDSGVWKCMAQTSGGNKTKAVNVTVMSEDTVYCSMTVTKTNKGTYVWPKTVGGISTDLDCLRGKALAYSGHSPARATYKCDDRGRWKHLDVSQCQYENQVTSVLETIVKLDLHNITKMTSRADQLRGFISNASMISDKMVVVYLATILESLSSQVADNEKLAGVILDVASVVMEANETILQEAQEANKSSTKIVKAIDEIPRQLLRQRKTVGHYTSNIAMDARQIDTSDFPGMLCAAYSSPGRKNVYNDDSFSCTTFRNNTPPTKNGQKLSAAISIPASVFKHVRCLYPDCTQTGTFQLQFIIYRNARLFPTPSSGSPNKLVSSGVISCKIVGVTVENTSEPIVVQLLSAIDGTNRRAVYWDYKARDGYGNWAKDGCKVTEENGNMTTLQCTHLTEFAVMQSIRTGSSAWDQWVHGSFQMSPAIYAGTGILAICMMMVIITYITSHRHIKMPSKTKHAICNLCVALLLLCVTFTLGVRTSQPILACQIIGIAIHYLSLSSLFWIAILLYIVYKSYTKSEKPEEPSTEPTEGPPPPKPILRFYLLGWGISILICGIATAIYLNHYAGAKNYCFLSLEQAIAPFYIPVGILVFINFVLFICFAYALQCAADNGGPIDEPQTEEVNEADLANTVDSVIPTGDTSVTGDVTIILDEEYSPASQARAVAGVLILYLLAWTSGALAVAQPLRNAIPHDEIIFSYLYGFSCSALGVLIVIFYCLGRKDARACWKRCCCCEKDATYNVSTSSITQLNGHVMRSSSSVEETFCNKSTNVNRHNGGLYGPHKPSNVSLLPSPTASETDRSLGVDYPNFYNPRQNGIARKYWEKNKHHKHMNPLNKDVNVDSGHSSHTDSRTQASDRPHMREPPTDFSIPLNIDIQKPGMFSASALPNYYSSLNRSQHSGQADYPYSVHQPLLSRSAVDKNHISPTYPAVCPGYYKGESPVPPPGGYYKGTGQISPPPLHMYPVTVQRSPLPTQIYPSGASQSAYCDTEHPLGHLDSYTGFSPSPPLLGPGAPVSNGSLPKMAKHPYLPVSKYMERNGSVPRLRDFDGQSSVSQEPNQKQSLDLHSMENSKPSSPTIEELAESDLPSWPSLTKPVDIHHPEWTAFSKPEKRELMMHPGSLEKDTQTGCGIMEMESYPKGQLLDNVTNRHPDSIPPETVSIPTVCHNDLDLRKPCKAVKRDSSTDLVITQPNNFLAEIAERIPVANKSSGETEELASPASASGGSCSVESHPNVAARVPRRHHRKKSRSRQRSWDSEFGESTSKSPAYAYVNHQYQQRVLNKLVKQNQESGNELVDQGVNWLPKSISEYDQLTSQAILNGNSSSSESEDSTDDVWVLQRGKRKLKKETSV